LRNKLAHDYGEILAERIWVISKKSIQELLKEIETEIFLKSQAIFETGYAQSVIGIE